MKQRIELKEISPTTCVNSNEGVSCDGMKSETV
jgi:hypothetical protein